jgi:hypothetical protein
MNFSVPKRLRLLGKHAALRVPYTATLLDYAIYELTRRHRPSLPRPWEPSVLERIRRCGFAVVHDYIDRDSCDRCIDDIEWIIRNRTAYVRRYSDLRVFGAELLSLRIMKFASDPALAALSDAIVRGRTLNAFTLANKVEAYVGTQGSGEGWHKDASFAQFKAILYLNEVTESNGAFQIVAGSHLLSSYLADMRAAQLPFRELRVSDSQLDRIVCSDRTRLTTISGPPGTLILANTACIHRGAPPVTGVRYALTNYFVEPGQVTPEFLGGFAPVDPEQVRTRARALRSGVALSASSGSSR